MEVGISNILSTWVEMCNFDFSNINAKYHVLYEILNIIFHMLT